MEEILDRVKEEVERSQGEYDKKFHSPEEAYGILRREYLELEAEFQRYKKGQPQSNMFIESMQLSAMCIKLMYSFWGTEKVGVKIKMYNAFRHSLGCQLLDQGEDLDLVREQLGHTKSEMTRRYAKRSQSKLSDALGKRRKVVSIEEVKERKLRRSYNSKLQKILKLRKELEELEGEAREIEPLLDGRGVFDI